MRSLRSRWILLAACGAGACTAVNSQVHIVRAEQAVARAEERGAADGAKYEYTLATRFLDKAREEVLSNRFGASDALAVAASGYADQAVIALEAAGRDLSLDEAGLDALPDTIGTDLEDVQDVMQDYVDLPEGSDSPDDLITDEEVEALFGQGAVQTMNEEVDGEIAPPSVPPLGGDPVETAPPPPPPPPVEPPPASDAGWQDLSPGDE